jgi:hypothetical protein
MVQSNPTERLTKSVQSGQVTFSGNPDIGATFTATGHLIPQLEVGLSALSGAVSTGVFVNLDASTDFSVATSTANLEQACANANTTFDVGIGAQGSFFNVFDASVRKSLFKANFPLLQVRINHLLLFSSFYPELPRRRRRRQNKCFGGSNSNATGARRRNARQAQVLHRDTPRWGSVLPLRPRDVTLVCPLSSSRAKVSINENIP